MGFSRTLRNLRKKVEPRLIYSPFLRLILFNIWFQIGFGAFFAVLVAGALYLPKIWRVSPPGFLPVIKISWLDMTQNWALKRSARKLAASGDYLKAARSWEGAVGQNPADASALRGFLENCVLIPRPDTRVYTAASSQLAWLLRLTGTNQSDVELVARVCEKFEWYTAIGYLLEPISDRLPPAAESAYIKALFHENRIAEFERRLSKGQGRLHDPELALYRLAYSAGWSNRGDSGEAQQLLKQKSNEGSHKTLATRLYMLACANRGKVREYGECLDRLSAQNEASTIDQAVYWELLASNGRKAEARKLAEAFTTSPASPPEAVRLAQTYLNLGLNERSREILKVSAARYRNSYLIWMNFAGLLESEKDWDELRAIALVIRADPGNRGTLFGYSYWLEGKADLEQGRKPTAEIAFRRASESSYEIPGLALAVGRGLTKAGYPKFAQQVLSDAQSKAADDFAYWDAYFDAAFAAQDAAGILKASQNCYRLEPENVSAMNRYAASLMVNRVNPDEAIKITLQLYAKYPNATATIINHSCALMLNNRASEALKLLERINGERLPVLESSAYYLALFEAYADLQMWDAAWRASDKIAMSTLLPIQRQWLEDRRKQLPKRLVESRS